MVCRGSQIIKTLIILFAFSILLFTASCATSSEKKSELELRGVGTQEEPYRIFTAEDLFQIALMINSGDKEAVRAYYVLENDIDLKNQEWISIGYYHPNFEVPDIFFQGNWDGNGYTISNLQIYLPSNGLRDENGFLKTMGIGFFSLLGENAVVKNLNIKGVDVFREGLDDGYYVATGSLVGRNEGGYIENCHVTEFVLVLEEQDKEIGGLVGINSGDIVNSSVQYSMEISELLTIYSGRAYIGGLCGLNSGKIKDSASKGTIHATGKNSAWNIGGFVGRNEGGSLENCQSSGRIESIEDHIIIGGMCGVNNGKIEKAKSQSKISATGLNSIIGEFIGENSGTTIDCACYSDPMFENPLVGIGNDDDINIMYSDL